MNMLGLTSIQYLRQNMTNYYKILKLERRAAEKIIVVTNVILRALVIPMTVKVSRKQDKFQSEIL